MDLLEEGHDKTDSPNLYKGTIKALKDLGLELNAGTPGVYD